MKNVKINLFPKILIVLCIFFLIGCTKKPEVIQEIINTIISQYIPVGDSQKSMLFAGYQAWHKSPSHAYPPYDSRDPLIISRHIDQAKAMGIDCFIVNWYGPKSGGNSNEEQENREFIDQATNELITQAEEKNFCIALMYDEGAVVDNSDQPNTTTYMPRVQFDLDYAKQYFDSPAYLKIKNSPALFIFPYENVDQHINWSTVRNELNHKITLIDKDPNPDNAAHDNNFDGFYAWVQATNGDWRLDGSEWGEEYLNWFYNTMKSASYADKVTVGGVWPGFDDLLASWGNNRFISRRGRQTYDDTMNLAKQSGADFIMIGTWNDFEEGTDIEFGIENAIDFNDENQDLFAATGMPLLRSWPLEIQWNAEQGLLDLQFYKDGKLIYSQQNSPGIYVQLQSGNEYEVKLWTSNGTPVSRWVTIRGQDHITDSSPIIVDAWSFNWSGNPVISDNDFLNASLWTSGQADYNSGDRSIISSDGESLILSWTFGSGVRGKYAQAYIELSQPISLAEMDVFSIDMKGSQLPQGIKVGFELKFEDTASVHAPVLLKEIAGIERWGNKITFMKMQFRDAHIFDWGNIAKISLAVITGDDSIENMSGTLSVRNLIGTEASSLERAIGREIIQHNNFNEIANNAINAIINRQTAVGLLTTWTEDNTSYLYGLGLALKALSLEGDWDEQVPVNEAAKAAEKLALFLANNQQPEGYWPRSWVASTGAINTLLESDGRIWMGDYPWPITGLQSYFKKTGDERVKPVIENALEFIKSLIDQQGLLSTINPQTGGDKGPVTSSESYAAVILALYESNEIEIANRMWDYIVGAAWNTDLRVWKESINEHRMVLFGNTWLAPNYVKKGNMQSAIDSLSLAGKLLYTCGPGSPCGLDGIIPLATWYEGTLSYIATGGPGSLALFDNLKNHINTNGMVPHYNDTIGATGNDWGLRVEWESLDGTSWLYYAASGNSPFEVTSGTPVTSQ